MVDRIFTFIIELGTFASILIIVNRLVKYINANVKKKSKKIIALVFIIMGLGSLFIRRFYVGIDTYYSTILLAIGFSNIGGGLDLFKNVKGNIA